MSEIQVFNEAKQEWLDLYAVAQADKEHPLWENYQKINLAEYEHMVLDVIDNEPAFFHGIYNNGRWPANVSRICNRSYMHPKFRKAGIGLDIIGRNITFLLDSYPRWGKDVLFISRGVQYNNVSVTWKKFEKFVEYLRKYTGYNDLVYDDRMYQCCPSACRDCYQFCVWYDPKGICSSLNIPSISQNDWLSLS